jgi:hypothetical protein
VRRGANLAEGQSLGSDEGMGALFGLVPRFDLAGGVDEEEEGWGRRPEKWG